MELSAKIESILFFKAEPVSLKELATMLECSEESIREGVETLKEQLTGRGVVLIEVHDAYMLGTCPEMSEHIGNLLKEELQKELGKAGLETLTIVLYRGPVTRAQIDSIRGVNSTFILRNLLIRGLIEKISHPTDQRSFLYRPTFELLAYLGISQVEDLPEYEDVQKELHAFEKETSESSESVE